MTFSTPLRPFRRPVSLGRSGFTLLELVAVIGIIALMSVLVVAGFSGIMKAVSATSGTDALRRALNLARQQACVDGEDTYVWVTDVNKFAVVRRAGRITGGGTGDRKPAYLQVGGREKTVRAKYVEDEFADLSSAEQKFVMDDSTTASNVNEVVKNYSGIKVFDMDNATMADIVVPPWFDGGRDAWVFGVPTDASGFDPPPQGKTFGSEYGWLIYPEQTLPSGYVFKGSYALSGDNAGDFDKGYDRKIHFFADGTVESGVDFELYEVSAKKTHKVKVSGSGKITIEIEDDDQGEGS